MPATTNGFQSTHHEPIDLEHREIAGDIDRLLQAVNTLRAGEAVNALDTLIDRCSAHFAHEERLMAEHAYSAAARHKEAHDLFLADARRAFLDLKRAGLTDGARRWANGRLQAWFRFHIAANDVGLGLFLASRGGTGPAREDGFARKAPVHTQSN